MRYIEVVGIDGAGKSRLCRSIAYKLGERARLIRLSLADQTYAAVQLVSSCESVSPMTRILTYMAAQSEVYNKLVSNLEGIDYLIGDRGYACYHAYQYGVGATVIDELWTIAMGGLFPDLLVFLDTPVSMCRERVARRKYPSVIDNQPTEFHLDVRERYLEFIASYKRGETLVLDGRRYTRTLRHIVLETLHPPMKET